MYNDLKNRKSHQLIVSILVMALVSLQLWSAIASETTTVVINEIAYRGTTAAATDEWIELYNASSEEIILTGWQLSINGNVIHLSGTISAHSYFLLERSDDLTISDRPADQFFSFSLSDTGAVLQLKNDSGEIVDQISSWHVALASPPPGFSNQSSMERISPYLSGDLAVNWRINDQKTRHGLDANGGPIFGTPGYHNSQTIHAFGYGYESIGALPVPIIPSPSTFNNQPSTISINELEILPPPGQKEWIELWNSTDNWFDLSTCSISDSAAVIISFTSSSSLLPGEMTTYDLSTAKLGDNGDIVELRCGETIIDRVEYGNQSTGTPYVSSEGYLQDLHYLPSPNGFNTLGRSPNGNSLWFLMSHEEYPTKGKPNPDLRPVPGVVNSSFIAGSNSVRLHWEIPEDPSIVGTKIYLKHSGAGNQFVLYDLLSTPESTALISHLPNELIEFRIVSVNDTGKESEGLQVSHLVINLLGIVISEVLPYPKSGFEFIEFHNMTDVSIDLTGYELSITNASADLNDPSGSFEFSSFVLSPNEYFAFFIDPDLYEFRLSNQSALITLSNPEGISVTEVSYFLPSRGVSIAYNGDLETTLFHPTPNAENIFQNAPPTAILQIQGSGKTQGCTVLDFNPTAASSVDPDEDELNFSWVYRTQSGEVLYTSNEENPTSFKFTESMGEFFQVRLTVSDPFGATSVVTIPLELQFCNGAKRYNANPPGTSVFSTSIYINEVYPNPPGSDTGVEFVELYNSGQTAVSLDKWKLGGKTKKVLDGEVIQPQQYFVFTKASLLNSANTIQLLDPASNIVSQVDYPDPEEGDSYSRDEKGLFRWTVPTPGAVNDFPYEKEMIYVQGTAPVVIHRIMPNPKGDDEGKEWIEIKNRTEDEINLSGWSLDNREGGSKPFFIASFHLNSNQIKRWYSSQTGISLRNTADQVRLFDLNGKLVDQLEWKTPVGDDVVLLREDFLHLEQIQPDTARVVRVIDGDTIDVRIFVAGEDSRLQNKTERVRLIGVDTPETVHPFKPLEFFGKEASEFTKSQLDGKTIRLEYDLTKRDKYGRILAYVFIGERHFNAELIENGYAFAYLRFPFKYREEFRLLQMKAQASKVGMWASGDVQEIIIQQEEFFDEEAEALSILEEILEELESDKEEEEKKAEEYDQTGWEQVKLNEILPNPKGSDTPQKNPEGENGDSRPDPLRTSEYIELINQSSAKVDLTNWKIINNKKKSVFEFKKEASINPSEILLLSQLKTTLKNITETIQLIDPLGAVRDELTYDQSMKDDQVWSRSPLTQSWQLRPKGTPGEPNELILIASGNDEDMDGLGDEDEKKLGLDPRSWDSDGNGYPDDFEVLMKYLQTSEENYSTEYESYLTKSLRMEMKQTARTITFFGESRPYTIVRLTLYSSPQTVSIPVLQDGTWSYKVGLGLEKGTHHAEAFAIDPAGKSSIKTALMPFELSARLNVSKLPKIKKAAIKKAPKIKPLYRVVDPSIKFYDGEVAGWDAEKGILTLNDGRTIQLPREKKPLGNIFLRLGQRIRYSLEHDQITLKNLEIIPSAIAKNSGSDEGTTEPVMALLLLCLTLLMCFLAGRRFKNNPR